VAIIPATPEDLKFEAILGNIARPYLLMNFFNYILNVSYESFISITSKIYDYCED
jgi:hypothetical protein